ncbi:MAG TPA: PQQ-binding-like beta-propeller repeat protein, partial [Ktedonobacterales bacterium]|nr:PQQ-binding-like beta-propeller repeat protein [Ktedonobacterales bacterium]
MISLLKAFRLSKIHVNDGSTIYAVAGPSAGDVVALAVVDGTIRWQAPSGDTLLALSGADSGTLYTGGISGVVSALSADDGTPRWRVPVGPAGQTSPVLRISLEQGTL